MATSVGWTGLARGDDNGLSPAVSARPLPARLIAPDLGGGNEPLDGITLVEDFSPPAKRDGDEEPAKHFQVSIDAVKKVGAAESLDHGQHRDVNARPVPQIDSADEDMSSCGCTEDDTFVVSIRIETEDATPYELHLRLVTEHTKSLNEARNAFNQELRDRWDYWTSVATDAGILDQEQLARWAWYHRLRAQSELDAILLSEPWKQEAVIIKMAGREYGRMQTPFDEMTANDAATVRDIVCRKARIQNSQLDRTWKLRAEIDFLSSRTGDYILPRPLDGILESGPSALQTTSSVVGGVTESCVPVWGEVGDVQIIFDSDAPAWQRVLAGGSLAGNFFAVGILPNASSVLRPVDEIASALRATRSEILSPRHLRLLDEGVGFRTFSELKNHLGPPPPGHAWHHIVGQNADNVARFGPEYIHNTANVIAIPHGKGSTHLTHIEAFLNSYRPEITGQGYLRVRDWLKTKSYQFQYEFGVILLRNNGVPLP